jgi:hypothetical protein
MREVPGGAELGNASILAMAKKSHRKPSEPLAKLIFRPGGGGTDLVVELLPEEKDDLELAIVTKFIGALQQAHGLVLGTPVRGDTWPDFETIAGTQKIGIEVVEVVEPDHALKIARQSQYLQELLPLVQDLEPPLDGVAITIDDGYQVPSWPTVRSAEGQRLLRHLAARIHAEADAIGRVPPGPGLCRRWDLDGQRVGIGALRGRRIRGDPRTGLNLRFMGTFPTDGAALVRAVEGKIEKRYGTYGCGDLWLLAYTQHYFEIEDLPMAAARSLLQAKDHPFAAVWAFVPLSGEEAGAVVRVFP